MKSVLVTGANRGIGLEFVRQYAGDGWRVHACCRDPDNATELSALAEEAEHVAVHRMDVTDHDQVDSVAKALHEEPIDLLVNNAGYFGKKGSGSNWDAPQSFGQMDYDDWMVAIRVNTFGPLAVSEAFIDHVAASGEKKIAALSTGLASIEGNDSGRLYAYRSSKAALNMVVRSMAADLKRRGVSVIALNPGWVKTRMGGDNATLHVEVSVANMRTRIAELSPAISGRFIRHDGRVLPW